MRRNIFVSAIAAYLLSTASCIPLTSQGTPSNLTYIAIEEHYDPPAAVSPNDSIVFKLASKIFPSYLFEWATDITRYRLPKMNQYGFRMQVVSMDPNPTALRSPSQATQMNDQLAAALKPYPDRFRGFCFPPMAEPDTAATELKRCVNELGFVGALVDCHLGNMTFYGNESYGGFWKVAEELQVPIYLHPTYPPGYDMTKPWGRDNDSSLAISSIMATSGFQWHVDAGLSFLHLWTDGVFDRFPNVKVVLGHDGETIPYMLQRVDDTLGEEKQSGVTVYEAWDENIWVTTSGFFSLDPFKTLLSTTKTDRIMFSVDYPWGSMEDATRFIGELKGSGLVTEQEWEGIAFRNAANLLNLTLT